MHQVSIRGGTVIDPYQGISDRRDVAIQDALRQVKSSLSNGRVPRTSCWRATPGLQALQTRIPDIPQGVAEHVRRKHNQADGDAGENGQPRRLI